MKKIKILRNNRVENLEEQANRFIQDKHNAIVDIKLQTNIVNRSYDNSGIPIEADVFDTLLIIYEE